MRPNGPNHVWAVDFVYDKLSIKCPSKMLTVVDEYTRQALAFHVAHQMSAADILEAMYSLLITHREPYYIRSDNGPEFTAEVFQKWLAKVGIKPIRVYPGSPCENGCNERFNGTLRREIVDVEWFVTTKQAQAAINI